MKTLQQKKRWLDYKKNEKEGIDVKNLTVGSRKKVWFLCSKNHSWLGEFKGASGNCPYCIGKRVLVGFNDLRTRFPAIAQEWHPTKNGLSSPEDFTAYSGKHAFWLCPKCGDTYSASISNRTKGRGCPCCVNKKLVRGINDFETVYPELVSEWSDKNALRPFEIRYNDDKQKVFWNLKNGLEIFTTAKRRIRRFNTPTKKSFTMKKYVLENEDFLKVHWNERLNNCAYCDIPAKNKKYRWRCVRCGNSSLYATIESAKKNACVCSVCLQVERQEKQAKNDAERQYAIARQCSFGQAAIAFYAQKIPMVEVQQEVLLQKERRFLVDIVVRDLSAKKTYAIEHDSDRFHLHPERMRSDAEKEGIMLAAFDKVFHVACLNDKRAVLPTATYSYFAGSVLSLEKTVKELLKEISNFPVDVDVRRDTMQILRLKNYQPQKIAVWHPLLLERLEEDWHDEDNAGYSLSFFSPAVIYHALWRCKKCGNAFYASIHNRVKGNECTRCKNRRKKVLPHESFAAMYPEKAKNWSVENTLLPTQVAPSAGYLAKWQCSVCGHRWQTTVCVVAQSKYSGCMQCGQQYSKQAKYKKVEKLDATGKCVLCIYESIQAAKRDGFVKVDRAIKEGKVYKGFLWKLQNK